MSKKNKAKNAEAATENAEGTEAAAGASRGRKVMLIDPTSGEQVARVDVIKELYAGGKGKSRSEIVKILKEQYNHEVAYQIVFAATKPVKGEAANANEGESEAGTAESDAA